MLLALCVFSRSRWCPQLFEPSTQQKHAQYSQEPLKILKGELKCIECVFDVLTIQPYHPRCVFLAQCFLLYACIIYSIIFDINWPWQPQRSGAGRVQRVFFSQETLGRLGCGSRVTFSKGDWGRLWLARPSPVCVELLKPLPATSCNWFRPFLACLVIGYHPGGGT